MNLLDLLVIVGCVAIGFWIVRSVMQPGIDLIDEGRRAAERLTGGPLPPVHTPPGPRSTPRVVTRQQPPAQNPARTQQPSVARPTARPAANPTARTTTTRPASSAASRTAAPRATTPLSNAKLDDWHLLLDVSRNASRREIQEALRLRLARARAERNTDAMRRLMRAAAQGLGQSQRGKAD